MAPMGDPNGSLVKGGHELRSAHQVHRAHHAVQRDVVGQRGEPPPETVAAEAVPRAGQGHRHPQQFAASHRPIARFAQPVYRM